MPPDFKPPKGPEEASARARYVLERAMDFIRESCESLDMPVEVGLLAVQISVEGFGSIVVALSHPQESENHPDASDEIALIAERVRKIYSGEDRSGYSDV